MVLLAQAASQTRQRWCCQLTTRDTCVSLGFASQDELAEPLPGGAGQGRAIRVEVESFHRDLHMI
jgi:hypothetical protein